MVGRGARVLWAVRKRCSHDSPGLPFVASVAAIITFISTFSTTSDERFATRILLTRRRASRKLLSAQPTPLIDFGGITVSRPRIAFTPRLETMEERTVPASLHDFLASSPFPAPNNGPGTASLKDFLDSSGPIHPAAVQTLAKKPARSTASTMLTGTSAPALFSARSGSRLASFRLQSK